ncbi:MAG: Calx-beta domain-containing protein [Planctomycetia bacterium]
MKGPLLGLERLEPRALCAVVAASDSGHMRVGMNLESVVDWSPAWTFTDAFKASRGWIAQEFNTATWETVWDVGATNPVRVDANGNPTLLTSRVNAAGETIRQFAATLMFRDTGAAHPAGTYRAEWDGTGVVTFGFDARVIASGRTPSGRGFADLEVTPSENGILMRVEETSPADPVRNFNVWMPDYGGQRFAGQRWQPGASFSPFHPLFRAQLAPFGTIRFMGMQETNTSDIRTWADRRDANDIRQGSGAEGSTSEPLANGMSLEYMVQLANDLDADPWFNMPHMADDTFVRNFATYVRDHLEPGRKVYVEWSNEIWNFGWGFEASQWVMDQTRLPNNAGLDNWQVAGLEAKRDLDIWSTIFAGQAARLVRVAGGWAANDWVTNRVVESMDGSFDAIAIAPYFSPDDARRATYTAATTVDTILAVSRAAVDTSVAWARTHQTLADTWSTRLGRDIQLVAYEGGPHMDGRNAPYQDAFYRAVNDPRMGEIYREYLKALDGTGMDLFLDFQLTGRPGASSWGDFAKLHRMDQPLSTAHRYAAVVAAADGTLWAVPPPAPPTLSIASAATTEGNAGRKLLAFTVSLSATASQPVSFRWTTGNGTALAGRDFVAGSGTLTIPAGQRTATVGVWVLSDRMREADEQFFVTLSTAVNATLSPTATRATGIIVNDDGLSRAVLAAAFASVDWFNAKARR